MFGVCPAQLVACVLDQRVLKAPAGPQKRHPMLASETNGRQRALHVQIWTGRHAPQAVEPGELRTAADQRRRQPFEADRYVIGLRRPLQGQWNGLMRGDIRIEVPYQTDPYPVARVICFAHVLLPV